MPVLAEIRRPCCDAPSAGGSFVCDCEHRKCWRCHKCLGHCSCVEGALGLGELLIQGGFGQER